MRLIEGGARALFDAMEKLDPTADGDSGWEGLDEHRRDFYRFVFEDALSYINASGFAWVAPWEASFTLINAYHNSAVACDTCQNAWARMRDAHLAAQRKVNMAEEEQWPPIETAPNSGQIRAFVPNYHQGKAGIIVATWLDWKESGCGWYDQHGRMVEPTHWMPPLPDE